jgi:hypothetical protein
MKDPLQTEGAERELFKAVTALCNDKPQELIWSVWINVLVNSIRQRVPYRKDAEAKVNELFGLTKKLLLDIHYDSVTGQRRSVFPFTQVIEAPFVVNESKIFDIDGGVRGS